MAGSGEKKPQHPTSPIEAIRGPGDALLLIMSGLKETPASGRLLRGLSPYLDGQGAREVLLLTERRRREPWGADDAPVGYQELVHWVRDEQGGVFRGTSWKGRPLSREELAQAFEREPAGVVDWAARRVAAAVISSAEPLALVPCTVAKPWGREIWYTGIEKRGRSRVRSATGETELPYALGMFPVPLIGEEERPPVLLKALEPLPQEVIGDLYLEVHERKWEVYVVLDVHRDAWPDGIGRLRAGLDAVSIAQCRAAHGSDWEARIAEDLRAAIARYEPVRRRLDQLVDEALIRRGYNPAQGTPAVEYAQIRAELPEPLKAQEVELRREVEGFLGLVPMPEGGVACLQPGVLHSLMHGVTVIEFQTPTYERLIAMFGQKVLTQPHWDTQRAVAVMHKAAYAPPTPEKLRQEEGLLEERIVDFPDFQVHRVTLAPGAVLTGRTRGRGLYQVLIGVKGQGSLEAAKPSSANGASFKTPLKRGEAMLLPAALGEFSVRNAGPGALVYLATTPEFPTAGT